MSSFPFIIKPIEHSDIDEIFDIEINSFSAPFTRGAFEYLLSGAPPFGGFKAVLSEKLIGYLIYSSVINEMEILTVAVKKENRMAGVGAKLLEEAVKEAKKKGVDSIFLEVRKSNTAGQKLYAKLGFAEIGIRRGYYRDNGEDAIVMKLSSPRKRGSI